MFKFSNDHVHQWSWKCKKSERSSGIYRALTLLRYEFETPNQMLARESTKTPYRQLSWCIERKSMQLSFHVMPCLIKY